MHSKQQSRHQAGILVQENPAHSQEKHTHYGVEDHVEEMVRSCGQLTEEVVHAKGEYSERSVGFMAPLLSRDTHYCCQMQVT